MHPCMLRAHAYNRLKLEKIYCSRLQLIFSYGFLRDHMQKSFFFHAGHLKYWHVKITVFLTKRLFNSPAYKNPPCLPILFLFSPLYPLSTIYSPLLVLSLFSPPLLSNSSPLSSLLAATVGKDDGDGFLLFSPTPPLSSPSFLTAIEGLGS